MNNKAIFLLAFTMGAATGVVGTWRYVKKKYEEIAQEEIDSVKEVFSRRDYDAKNIAESIKDFDRSKPDMSEYVERLKKESYINYSDMNVEEKGRKESMDKPYIITPESFGQYDEYDKVSLTYYADQILADENDEIIEDVETVVGFESLNHFGDYEDDSVFVRNDARKCDYEILMDQNNYSDVAKLMLHQRGYYE